MYIDRETRRARPSVRRRRARRAGGRRAHVPDAEEPLPDDERGGEDQQRGEEGVDDGEPREQAEVADHREVIADLAGKDGVAKHERQRRAELVAEKTGEDPETILEQEA